MNSVLWIAQILLAGAFFYTGLSKILVFKRQASGARAPSEAGCAVMSDGLAAAIALLEIVGALGLIIPVDLGAPYILACLCAGGLALLAVIIGVHQACCHEHTTPIITMLILAIFVIVGRWPIQPFTH